LRAAMTLAWRKQRCFQTQAQLVIARLRPGDPVFQSADVLHRATMSDLEYWFPAFAGMTAAFAATTNARNSLRVHDGSITFS
jgi:hypothetical protein